MTSKVPVVVCMFLVACLGGGVAGPDAETDSGTEPGSGAAVNAETDPPDTGGSEELKVLDIASCVLACDEVSDCDQGAPTLGTDNHTCEDGGCLYTGCTSTEECLSYGEDYTCAEVDTGYPTCMSTCESAMDCDLGLDAFDADNHECEQGVCVYKGCNSTIECQALGDFVCGDGGTGIRTCLPPCTTVKDCDMKTAPYDLDNYTCEEGGCVYQGCNSDKECTALGDYVCR